jgi:ABC-2 type transport system ATP-binding protein
VADYPDISKISHFDENSMHLEVEFQKATTGLEQLQNISAVNALSDTSFSIIANTDIRAEIFDFAVKSGNKILTMKTVERSIEDVFKSLTK